MNDGTHTFGGFWRRAAAWTIDQIAIFTAGRYLTEAFLAQTMLMRRRGGYDIDDFRDDFLAPNWYFLIGLLCTGLFAWLYHSGMESSPLRATLGKLAIGLQVTNLAGKRISFSHATARHFSKIVSALFLGIGYLLAGFLPNKQALHDLMTGCLVLDRECHEMSAPQSAPATSGDLHVQPETFRRIDFS